VSVSFDVISIGCLSRQELWNEKVPVRAAHATTTLVRDERITLIVDPSLPVQLLERLLHDRSGLRPDQVEAVFLTTFRPVHRRGLALFGRATWLMAAEEIKAVRAHLRHTREQAAGQPETLELVGEELAVLERLQAAPDQISPQIHLFPTPGASAGSASLLLVPANRTIAVAGDAVLTREHFERGQVFNRSFDAAKAGESLMELAQVADIIVPGHDNVFVPYR